MKSTNICTKDFAKSKEIGLKSFEIYYYCCMSKNPGLKYHMN